MKIVCLVSQANGVIHKVELDQKANGQECLDTVFQRLQIIEVDYFGLEYRGSKGEQLWLNMRNRIDQQAPGPSPYSLSLKVKFFVPPHSLLQEATRHQFCLQLKQDIIHRRLHVPDQETLITICALIMQSETGDASNPSDLLGSEGKGADLYTCLVQNLTETPAALAKEIATEHRTLAGMKRSSADYKMLQVVSELPQYGMVFHEAKNCDGQNIQIGVGPRGLEIFDENFVMMEKINFQMMQLATLASRCVFVQLNKLNYLPSSYEEGSTVGFKLVSQKAAKALYRRMTETHSFYRCDTVRSIVSTQFCRDLKGTLVSLFNENTSLGKSYIFDIKRTSREVHDHVRRKLYMMSQQLNDDGKSTDECLTEDKTDEDKDEAGEKVECLKQELHTLRVSFTCRVCMDAPISTVLCPCGHLVCCRMCAEHIKVCPLCRNEIQQIQKVYLPLPELEGNKTDYSQQQQQ